MPHKYVSSTMFTTPMGVVRWVRLQLKSIEKLSHETAPPVLRRYRISVKNKEPLNNSTLVVF